MSAHVAAIYRHPVKGFTPEQLGHADLLKGQGFPCDRIYAVENGPSGFDPDAPGYVSKMKFTVLASLPQVALAQTNYDEATSTFRAVAPGQPSFAGQLSEPHGRAAFEAWLKVLLGDEAHPDIKVLQAPGYQFMDHPKGHVSIINMASLRDLEAKIGQELDPLRFRGNLYVEGWPAWVENDWADRDLMVGFARTKVYKPIVRCAATHVDPTTAEADIDVVKALFDNYGHMDFGIYVHVTDSGRVSVGDAATAPQNLA